MNTYIVTIKAEFEFDNVTDTEAREEAIDWLGDAKPRDFEIDVKEVTSDESGTQVPDYGMENGLTVVVYGTADRDPDEHVFMVFEDIKEASQFIVDLPGKYDVKIVTGIDYDKFEIVL